MFSQAPGNTAFANQPAELVQSKPEQGGFAKSHMELTLGDVSDQSLRSGALPRDLQSLTLEKRLIKACASGPARGLQSLALAAKFNPNLGKVTLPDGSQRLTYDLSSIRACTGWLCQVTCKT
jgi:hypothetical protein